MSEPVVYFAHAAKDREFAERIARALMAAGIQTFFDEWEIRGDSLPQKLSAGLDKCTHFVVLLTRISIDRPWVKLEIDAGPVRMLGGKSHFPRAPPRRRLRRAAHLRRNSLASARGLGIL